MQFIHAHVNTGHYTFDAYGSTADEAEALLRAAWVRHVGVTGADPHMMRDLITEGDVNYLTVTVGTAYRDGSLIASRGDLA